MSLAPGTRIGVYEITAPLGAGGMGEVYRARDSKLNREVAIKVLPVAFTHDPDRLARFTREAHVLAALNHPHIAAIYGIEDSADMRALVLELVEGDTLADRIALGRVPYDEAVSIAREICEALQAAHDQGIVHRDLKPSNIKITPDGAVKVLDFGLAKLVQVDGAATRADVTLSPTITTPALMTAAGIVLGTAAYMSPEQAKGREADKRSDVWAFGCVLYEMLTGRRAFDGEDMTDVLGAVVRLEPDWQALPFNVPASIRTLLQQCLVKDRRKRIADIAAARFALDHLAVPASSTPAVIPQRDRQLVRLALVSAVVAIATATGAFMLLSRRGTSAPVVRTTIATSRATALALSGLGPDVAITNDGSRVVYRGDNALLVRALNELEPKVLVRGAFRNPFTSPDGKWVGIFDGSLLKKVPIVGGAPETVATVTGDGAGATWAEDGTIIFATAAPGIGLQRVPATGGTPTVVTKLARDERDHVWPEFVPGGKAVLYTVIPATGGVEDYRIDMFDLQTGETKVLVRGGSYPRYARSGHLLYLAGGTLQAVPFDLRRLEVSGTTARVVDDIAMTRVGAGQLAIAATGTLAYVSGVGGARRNILFLDDRGRTSPLPGVPPGIPRQVRVSPDGTRLAFSLSRDIWIYDFVRAVMTPLTTDPGSDTNPLWTPNGQRVVFTSIRNGYPELFWRAADGTGSDEKLLTRGTDLTSLFATGWSRDGQRLIFTEVSLDVRKTSIGQMSITQPSEIRTLLNGGRASVSPDGRWIAYESNASGRSEIYVERYPELGNRQPISASGGREPRWSRDGRTLFFGTENGRQLFAVDITPGSTLAVGRPRVLVEDAMDPIVVGEQSYDVAPDGRFLVIRSEAVGVEGAAPAIVLVQNWFEELKHLVPTD